MGSPAEERRQAARGAAEDFWKSVLSVSPLSLCKLEGAPCEACLEAVAKLASAIAAAEARGAERCVDAGGKVAVPAPSNIPSIALNELRSAFVKRCRQIAKEAREASGG